MKLQYLGFIPIYIIIALIVGRAWEACTDPYYDCSWSYHKNKTELFIQGTVVILTTTIIVLGIIWGLNGSNWKL